MIYEYVLYTGDEEILWEVKRAVNGIIERFKGYTGDNGLIEYAPNYMFMDWVEEGKWNRHHPPKCMGQGYMTAMYANALDYAAMIFDIIEDHGTADKFRVWSKTTKEAVHSQLWDEHKNMYIDGLYDQNAVFYR